MKPRLLPRLMQRRRRGPVFLAAIAPALARQPALADLDSGTGHARLPYRRAAEVINDASKGWTLYQPRHSRLTHLAEAGIELPMLMTKSRHIAAIDPARRRRSAASRIRCLPRLVPLSSWSANPAHSPGAPPDRERSDHDSPT